MSNPWRHGDLNELIVKASEAGDTSRVKALEKVRAALTRLEATKAAIARRDIDPLAALAEASPAINDIFACIDDAGDES